MCLGLCGLWGFCLLSSWFFLFVCFLIQPSAFFTDLSSRSSSSYFGQDPAMKSRLSSNSPCSSGCPQTHNPPASVPKGWSYQSASPCVPSKSVLLFSQPEAPPFFEPLGLFSLFHNNSKLHYTFGYA